METNQNTRTVHLDGPENCVELKSPPSMAFILIKALLLGITRPGYPSEDTSFPRTRIELKNQRLDKNKIEKYKLICGFESGADNNDSDYVPISYFQTLFTPVLGRFITSDAFPVNPLGLIHTYQSFCQTKPVSASEILDLSCVLTNVSHTQKGLESSFTLEVKTDNELVWQGISTFLTRKKGKKNKKDPKKDQKKDQVFLDQKESFSVPSNTGRRYAGVSRDFNPHHLHSIPAKLFGFKRAIAHGMWTLAKVLSSLDKSYNFTTGFGQDNSLKVEAWFKRPVFMPANLALGYEEKTSPDPSFPEVDFELRDEMSSVPHLKGHLAVINREL